ncbi:SDR family oxidoreductase [Sorangium sp. So ce429]
MSGQTATEAPRLAIVSAGAAGIGLATARAFLAEGYACLILDKDHEALDGLRETLGSHHGDRLAVRAIDVVTDDVASVVAPLRRFEGHSLHLVNNLGGSAGPRRPIEALEWSDFESTIAYNLRATVQLTRAVLPLMRAGRRGWIVNVSSIAGRTALDYVGADYAAAKAALLGLTRTMARELAGSGILVNAICPGIIGTARILNRWSARTDGENARMMSGIPLGRLGTPEEVARACLFLGSCANEYITGAVLDVNGGAFLP